MCKNLRFRYATHCCTWILAVGDICPAFSFDMASGEQQGDLLAVTVLAIVLIACLVALSGAAGAGALSGVCRRVVLRLWSL